LSRIVRLRRPDRGAEVVEEVEHMARRRLLQVIAVCVDLLLMMSVVVGVTPFRSDVEREQASDEMAQGLVDAPPKVAEAASSNTSAESATLASQTCQATWSAVGNWMGYGSKDTERFITRGNEWRITWKTTGASRRVCALGIYVYDSSGAFVTLAAIRQGVSSDVSYVRAQPGEFYLSVISCAADWEIAVEDCY